MQFNIAPDLQALVHNRLSSGEYASAEEFLRRALEVLEADANRLRKSDALWTRKFTAPSHM